MNLKTVSVAFIGTGNMAKALINGMLAQGMPAVNVHAADINADALAELERSCGIQTFLDNQAAIDGVDVVVLAVKPQILPMVAPDLSDAVAKNKCLVVSIAAGVTAEKLAQWLGEATPIVRCMPNTPAMVGCGATGLYANAQVSNKQRDIAQALLQTVGITEWVDDEALIDAITALSGSGPAYFFYLMEAMISAGERLGLAPELSKRFALQTALGSAKLASQSADSPAVLRQKVTSPGGTTAAALGVFDENKMQETIIHALQAADARAKELS